MLPASELRGGLKRDQGGPFSASLRLFLLAEERAIPCFRRVGGKIFRAVDNYSLTKGRWPFESKCIKHAVCRSSDAKNTIVCNGVPKFDKTTVLSLKPRRAVTFFRKESNQRFARGYTPLTPAVCSATRQSEQSSVAVEGGATRTGDHGVNWLAAS